MPSGQQAIRAIGQSLRRRPWLFAGGGIAAVVVVTVSLVAALAGSAAPVRPRALTMVPHHAWPAAPTPTPTKHRPTRLFDPLTGEPAKKLGRVLAVKIDNIVTARPQTGLQSADLVYVIPVEGGLSRFMAVFSSHIPPVIGPVRSARQSDLDILRQFGRPAFAWSGATPHLVPFVERAPLVDLYALKVGGFYRINSRVAPENLYANPRTLLREAPHASTARDIGFRFGALPAGGRAIHSMTVRYPAATFSFRWSAKAGRWLVWMDGAPGMAAEGGQLGGKTVIIQYTRIATSRFEEYGGRPPYATSVGSGKAVILRNGRAYTVRWSRPNLDSGTTFTQPDGKRMLFAPGQVWVMYAPNDHASYVNAGAV
ncbi:MAG TPA: DUF3048 domain-containing protein [Trebonia sp.]|jgi:hypothetical protein|nr:DUF3048 domain-containing protein [Trebonia sp.]